MFPFKCVPNLVIDRMEIELLERWDATHRFTHMYGWDFSALEGRMTSEEPDWDFEAECRDALGALADAG